jgi:hypothetical protein
MLCRHGSMEMLLGRASELSRCKSSHAIPGCKLKCEDDVVFDLFTDWEINIIGLVKNSNGGRTSGNSP